jgi:glycosyltransferase involved in cell wall biosynthesis
MNIAFIRDGPLKPTTTGGAVRIYNLLKHIADKEPTHLFWANRPWCDPLLVKDEKFSTLIINPERFYDATFLCELLREKNIEAIYIDTPENLVLLGNQIKRDLPHAIILYDAHDVVTTLLKRLAEPEEQIARMKLMEHLIGMIADKISCVSEHDKAEFISLGIPEHKLTVIENGADECPLHIINSTPDVCFMGNNYYAPNKTALSTIITTIAPALYARNTKIKIHIIGNTPPELIVNAPNITYHGIVHDLKSQLAKMTLGICPLKEGSGTRIKILDWMAYGVPVITTTLGAEGIEVKNGEHLIIEDKAHAFPEKIIALLNDTPLREKLRYNAHKLIQDKYSWNRSAQKMRAMLLKEYESRRY